MGDFVNLIRAKLGLEPKRDLTLTGKIPTEVVVNRVMREGKLPTISARDDFGNVSSLNKLAKPRIVGNIGLDGDLPNSIQLQRRREFKRNTTINTSEDVDLDGTGALDTTKPEYGVSSNPLPTKIPPATVELPDDGGLKRGSKVKIKKDGYSGHGNIDFYDKHNKKYVISGDEGRNLVLSADEIEPVKEDTDHRHAMYIDGHFVTTFHAKSKEEAKRKFFDAYPEHKGKKVDITNEMNESFSNYIRNRLNR